MAVALAEAAAVSVRRRGPIGEKEPRPRRRSAGGVLQLDGGDAYWPVTLNLLLSTDCVGADERPLK